MINEWKNNPGQSQVERERGVAMLIRFLTKIIPEHELLNPSVLTQKLTYLSFSEFVSFSKRINGILNGIPAQKNREMFDQYTGVVDYDKNNIDWVPPQLPDRRMLMREAFSAIRQLSTSNHPDAQEAIARTLYNAITYIHPFTDANGRTSRLSYILFSSHLKKDSFSLKEIIEQILQKSSKTDEDIHRYHTELQNHIAQAMLRERGLPDTIDPERKLPLMRIAMPPLNGFDIEIVHFFAAYDVMTQKERERYMPPYNGTSDIFFFDSLPDEITKKIRSYLDSVRKDITRKILEFSWRLDTTWPPHLETALASIFTLPRDPVLKK